MFLLNAVREQSCPYNEFCLPLSRTHEVCIISYFPSEVRVPGHIEVRCANGSMKRFLQLLKAVNPVKAFDIVHAHSPQLGFLYGSRSLGLADGRRTVYTVHSSFTSANLGWRNRMLFAPVFMRFGRVVFVSRSSERSFPPWFRRLAGSRTRVIHSGIDLDRVDSSVADLLERRARDRFHVAAVGRLMPLKQPVLLLRAFRIAGVDGCLTFLGDGELRDTLRTRAHVEGLAGRVRLPGFLSRRDVYRSLANADLFVSASRGEALPISVLEAMACGRPVVLSDIGPHREIAGDADFIPLVAPTDVDGFAREIRRFAEMPAEQRRAVGLRCRTLVERRFSLAAMGAKYEVLYSEVANRNASRPRAS